MSVVRPKYRRHSLSLSRPGELIAYFEKYLTPVGQCLEWTRAAKGHNRYEAGRGRMWIDGRLEYPYRVVAALVLGFDMSSRAEVQHSCNNPLCCRPSHLVIGTHAENMKYMAKIGRSQRGEYHTSAVMTDAKVVWARRVYASGGASISKLAMECGVNVSTMHSCLLGRTWKHIPLPERAV